MRRHVSHKLWFLHSLPWQRLGHGGAEWRVSLRVLKHTTDAKSLADRFSPHWRVGFLFLVLYPLLPSFLPPALLPQTLTITHTHSLHTHTHTHITHTSHSDSLTLTHTHIHTYHSHISLTLTHTHTHSYSLTHTHTHSLLTHTHTCSELSYRILLWNASYVQKQSK